MVLAHVLQPAHTPDHHFKIQPQPLCYKSTEGSHEEPELGRDGYPGLPRSCLSSSARRGYRPRSNALAPLCSPYLTIASNDQVLSWEYAALDSLIIVAFLLPLWMPISLEAPRPQSLVWE